MSGADEKIRAVLKVTADDVAGWLFATGSLECVYADDTNTIESALIKHLLPLLLAGQANRDNYAEVIVNMNKRLRTSVQAQCVEDWDAALAAAQGQPERANDSREP